MPRCKRRDDIQPQVQTIHSQSRMYKRILIITDNMRDQVNGVVTTFNAIEVEALKEGYQFYFIDPSNFKHFSAPFYSEVKLSIPFRIGRLIECVNADHIHIATEGPVGLAGRIYCDKRGYRYNTSYHTKFPEFLKKMYYVPESLTYMYLRWFHKHSGLVLTNTQSMIEELRDNDFHGDIRLWGRGVNDSFKSNESQDGSILYVGRVSKEKNLDELCKLENEYNIILVGDGPYRESLEKRYKKVNFVGYKHGKELADYYKRASVFLFPSKADTFGIVIIEAMRMGTPVVAYNVTGPKDIIENNVTGILTDNLNDGINKALLLDRSVIEEKSKVFTWQSSWNTFRENLIEVKS